jgi:hypothetical protein
MMTLCPLILTPLLAILKHFIAVELLASDEPFHRCVFQYYDTLKVRCAGVSHQAFKRPQKPLASRRFLVFRQTSVLSGVSITNKSSVQLAVFTSFSEHRLLYEFVTPDQRSNEQH